MLSTTEKLREFTAFFPFCGLGAGAMGFLDAEVRLFNRPSRFRSIGGIDIDKEACLDFERLTDSPAMHGDMHEITADDIRAFFGSVTPDVVFSSPPCTGFSGLLSKEMAKKEKYQRLNRLVPKWVELMLETWNPPPRLIIMENVPRITVRGKELLVQVHQMLGAAGYLVEQGFHDCGELGGLAQHRRRFLLVGRNPSRCAPILYKPPLKRVRGCGEVLETLPIPGTREAERYGRIHELPRISLMNMIRLALIPAGGDWRDIPGVLKEHQKRREVYADPRMATDNPNRYHNKYRVMSWDAASKTVTGGAAPTRGAYLVADPRLSCSPRAGAYGVVPWTDPAGVVMGAACFDNSKCAVADPRLNKAAFNHAYRVLTWSESSFTVAGPGVDVEGVFVPWEDLLYLPAILGMDSKRPPKVDIVIIGPDGCWHRPMTTLELAALQGLPIDFGGKPLTLEGNSVSRYRKRIGNAVPVQTAQAIAERMLVTLSDAQEQSLELFPQNGGECWVEDRISGEVQVSGEGYLQGGQE